MGKDTLPNKTNIWITVLVDSSSDWPPTKLTLWSLKQAYRHQAEAIMKSMVHKAGL